MQQNIKGVQQEPIVVPPDSGEELNIAGSQNFHKIKSEDTNGVFSVMEFVTPPGKGVALHVHEREDELVYLLLHFIYLLFSCYRLRLGVCSVYFAADVLPRKSRINGAISSRSSSNAK